MITRKTIQSGSSITTDKTNDYYGLSTDTKPTSEVPNASMFYEIDTGNIYLYNKDGGTWVKQNIGGNSGGSSDSGSGSGGIFIFTITESNGSYSSDKTYDEIKAAYLAGAYLIAVNGGIYYPLINIMNGLESPYFYFMLTRIFKGDPNEGNPDNITSTQFVVTINGITKIVMNYES